MNDYFQWNFWFSKDYQANDATGEQMGRRNVHKAPRRSQLTKIDTGPLKRNNLAWTHLVRWPHMARHGERYQYRGANGNGLPEHAQGTRAVTTSQNWYGHPRTKQLDPNPPDRATSHGATRCVGLNDDIREKMENGPPEHAQGTRAITN